MAISVNVLKQLQAELVDDVRTGWLDRDQAMAVQVKYMNGGKASEELLDTCKLCLDLVDENVCNIHAAVRVHGGWIPVQAFMHGFRLHQFLNVNLSYQQQQ
jgi:hypothetical protein